MEIYKATERTEQLNNFIKRSGAMLEDMAVENTDLWNANLKLSESNEALRCEVKMQKVAFDMARSGRLEYKNIPSWTQEKLSSGHSPEYFEKLLRETRDLGPAEFARAGRFSKKSSAPTVVTTDKKYTFSPSMREALRALDQFED